jgi:hypothetical protein
LVTLRKCDAQEERSYLILVQMFFPDPSGGAANAAHDERRFL